MSLRDDLVRRSAAVYADFLIPHLAVDARVLDCGCGSGCIAIGIREAVSGGFVVGLELDPGGLGAAARHVREAGAEHIHFLAGDGTALPFDDDGFDAVLCHSVLEAAADPPAILREIRRVLVPGGIAAVASVEYGGLILAGPASDRLHRFYAVRERLWDLEGVARPRSGRDLRRLLGEAGFSDVRAFAHYLSYGTAEEVRAFGEDRARDCVDPWYADGARTHGLLSSDELKRTQAAWLEWSSSRDAFAAFAWCRATARKP